MNISDKIGFIIFFLHEKNIWPDKDQMLKIPKHSFGSKIINED